MRENVNFLLISKSMLSLIFKVRYIGNILYLQINLSGTLGRVPMESLSKNHSGSPLKS